MELQISTSTSDADRCSKMLEPTRLHVGVQPPSRLTHGWCLGTHDRSCPLPFRLDAARSRCRAGNSRSPDNTSSGNRSYHQCTAVGSCLHVPRLPRCAHASNAANPENQRQHCSTRRVQQPPRATVATSTNARQHLLGTVEDRTPDNPSRPTETASGASEPRSRRSCSLERKGS